MHRHYKKNKSKGFLRHLSHNLHHLPIETTHGRVAIFHGYTGHARQAAIRHLTDVLLEKMRFSVTTCDFPFHGLSNDPEKPEDLGKITSFRRWVHTVRVMTYQVLKLWNDGSLGIFLVSESSGALALLRFLQVNPEIQKYLAGVIILAVPLEVDQNASVWVQRNKKLLEPVFSFVAWTFPNLGVGALPDGDKTDTLEYHGKVRARTAKEIRDAVFEARKIMELAKITVPMLFIHSDSDGVALPGRVEIAYRSVATPADKKDFKIYRGAPHKVMHLAVDDILLWIRGRNAAKDWMPFQEEGVVNESVKLSAAWVYAIQKTLLFIPTILPFLRKNFVAIFKKITRQN